MPGRRSPLLHLVILILLAAACRSPQSTQPPVASTLEGDVVIVDDQDEATELLGPWRAVDVDGAYGDGCLWAPLNPTLPNEYGYTAYEGDRAAYAYIRPALPRAGTYELFAHWCAPPPSALQGESIATSAELQVHPTRGRVAYTPVVANMTTAGDEWHSLGRFYLEPDGFIIAANAEGPANGAVVVDAFRFVWRSAEREEPPANNPIPPPQPSATP